MQFTTLWNLDEERGSFMIVRGRSVCADGYIDGEISSGFVLRVVRQRPGRFGYKYIIARQ